MANKSVDAESDAQTCTMTRCTEPSSVLGKFWSEFKAIIMYYIVHIFGAFSPYLAMATESVDAESDAQTCSMTHCTEPSSGLGKFWSGQLCERHLAKDEKIFAGRYADIKSKNTEPLAKTNELLKSNRGALFDLTSDRAEAADLFDAIFQRLQQCRENVIGRLDSKIDNVEQNLIALGFIEKLSVEIGEEEAKGVSTKGFRLHQEVQISLEDAPISEEFVDPVDNSVQQVLRLQQVVETFADEAEDPEDKKRNARLESAVPTVKVAPNLTSNVFYVFAAVCCNTTGYYFSAQAVRKTNQNGFQALPSGSTFCVANNNSQYWFFMVCRSDMQIISQWNVGNNGVQLASGTLVDHLQQIFLLGTNQSLIVTDLTGTQLRSVQNVQCQAPISLTHDMEKLYILSNGCVNCLSLESLELQQSLTLPDHVKDARSVTASGRSLILATPSAVHRLNIGTGGVKKLIDSQDFCVAVIDSGLIAVFETNGNAVFLSSSGQRLKSFSLTNSGFNYVNYCQTCRQGNYNTTCQSIICSGAYLDSTSCFVLLVHRSCSHQLLGRVSFGYD
ncbi:hypothetical protein BOX15_Mlig017959g3 [Macrostomum lignano]|uniref:Uncharacterized protein n=1 Tax=Macrostomum lignano TaxID=282301 RepID=A0A267GLU8_9PLAT|nr:hypothetical protein BOX15_Mlig017959g3 [Macrostomum lignano]